MKARGLSSPDAADALACTFAVPTPNAAFDDPDYARNAERERLAVLAYNPMGQLRQSSPATGCSPVRADVLRGIRDAEKQHALRMASRSNQTAAPKSVGGIADVVSAPHRVPYCEADP